MRLTIHRGANQIGGSCVEIATDEKRIILDVGTPLDAMDDEFSTPLNVPGLFQEGERVDAILLSHSHLDHCGLLPVADPKIPVYLSKGADQALSVLRLFAGQNLLGKRRPKILIPGRKEIIGDISVTPFAVDHSAPGCLAFLIETNDRTLLYSGDLRLHGRKPHLFDTIQRAMKGKKIDVLLMEGTTLSAGRGKGRTEEELENKIHEEISHAPGLVFALFSPLHLDRLKSFLHATQRSGRKFVPDLYAAYVMHMFQKEGLPSPACIPSIPVFFNQGCQRKIKRSKLEPDFERNRIALTQLLSSPQKYVVPARLSSFDLDFRDIPLGATFIYSFWSGYLEQPEWKTLQERIKKAGGHFVRCHTSGHIFPDDIKRFIDALRPEMLVPIHTLAASAFKKLHPRIKLLEDGEALNTNVSTLSRTQCH
jgi:ribonuclease J